MRWPVYHPRANGLSERAAQTVKLSLQALCFNLNVSFGALLQRALMEYRNTSKTSGKTSVELLLGRRVRLLEIADFDFCETFVEFDENLELCLFISCSLIIRSFNRTF